MDYQWYRPNDGGGGGGSTTPTLTEIAEQEPQAVHRMTNSEGVEVYYLGYQQGEATTLDTAKWAICRITDPNGEMIKEWAGGKVEYNYSFSQAETYTYQLLQQA